MNSIQEALVNAQAAANQETKSSAGDKHETGRAMMQLETGKLRTQLENAHRELEKLQRIDPEADCTAIGEGALVTTGKVNLFFSISAGEHRIGDKRFISLSIDSPLGIQMKGKRAGESCSFGNTVYDILEVR